MLMVVTQFFGQPFDNRYGRVIIQPTDNERSIELRIENITEPCDIEFSDENGRALFTDRYWTRNGYAKRINLSNLESGKYLVKITTDEWVYDQPVELTGKQIFVSDEEINWYVFPTLEVTDESIKVVTSETGTVQANEMVLFNHEGDEIFSYNMKKRNPKIDISFDISKLEAGDYTVALVTPAKTIRKELHRQ